MGPLELSTRRQILTALLGAPWAVACRRRPAFDFDGGFIEDNRRLGHAWRDGRLSTASPGPERRVEVLILGGGVAALVAGWRLRQAGLTDFAVLEIGPQVGGTAVGGASAVTGYPWGAHYLPAPTSANPGLVELLAEMGAVVDRDDRGEPVYGEGVLCAAPQERVFYKGRWYPGLLPEAVATVEDRRQMAEFRRRVEAWIAFRDDDGRRAFTIPIAAASDDRRARALDQQSMAEWLARHGLTAPLVRAAVDYACRDDFGARPSEVSAWYGLHYFAARTPQPKAEPAPFLTWPEGNGRIVDHLAGRIGADRLRPSTGVRRVQRRPDGWAVDTFEGPTARPGRWRAQQVVCALPSFLRRRLFEGVEPSDYRPTYGSWLVANLHLSGRPGYDGFETAWDNVIHESRSLGYVVATHQLGSAYGPTVWTWYLPFTGADAAEDRRRLEQLDWSSSADLAVTELDAVHRDLARYVERVDVRRWGHAMVRPEPGLAFGRDRIAAARSIDGLHFAHTDLSGVALFEEAFYHGDRAAKAVLRAWSRR